MSSKVSSKDDSEVHELDLTGDNQGYDYLDLDPATMTHRVTDNEGLSGPKLKTPMHRPNINETASPAESDKIQQLLEKNASLKTALIVVSVVYGILLLILCIVVFGVIGVSKGDNNVEGIPPKIVCPPDQTVTVPCNTGGTNQVYLQPCKAVDNSGTVNLVSQSHQTGQFFQVGPTEVTFTFTDLDGNRASGSYIVNVMEIDDTPPVCRQTNDIQRTISFGSGAAGTAIAWIEPTATDVCSSVTLVSRSHAPGDRFFTGITRVSSIFSDASNNGVTCSFSIVITEDSGWQEPTDPTRNNTGTSGAVYVRWGRTTCPSVSEIAYAGIAGGKWYSHSGTASNYLCLPEDPEYDEYRAGVDTYRGYVYSAEYQTYNEFPPYSGTHDHDVPCAVCRTSNRGSVMMIPAKMTCPFGWTEEFHGYLMSDYYNHKSGNEFVCVDRDPEVVPGSAADRNGAVFHLVEGRCDFGNLPCSPYINGAELTCVVCSK